MTNYTELAINKLLEENPSMKKIDYTKHTNYKSVCEDYSNLLDYIDLDNCKVIDMSTNMAIRKHGEEQKLSRSEIENLKNRIWVEMVLTGESSTKKNILG